MSLCRVNSRRSLVDRGSEGIELRTLDLDVSPQLESCSTIEWADAAVRGFGRPACSPLLTGMSRNHLETVLRVDPLPTGLIYDLRNALRMMLNR